MGLPSQQVSMDVWWQGDLLPLARQSEGLPWRIIGLCRVWGRWLGCLPQRHELHLGSFCCCWQTLSVWVLKHVKLYILISSMIPTLIRMRCLGVPDNSLSFGKKYSFQLYSILCSLLSTKFFCQYSWSWYLEGLAICVDQGIHQRLEARFMSVPTAAGLRSSLCASFFFFMDCFCLISSR